MSDSESHRQPIDPVRQLIANGPDVNRRARFGPFSRFLRRTIGRAVMFERHHHDDVNLALLDRIESLRSQLSALEQRDRALEERIARDARRLNDVDTRAAVATSIADDAAEKVRSVSDELGSTTSIAKNAAEKAGFVYAEVVSTPYLADPALLYTTDAEGQTKLGYRDGPGPTSVYAGFEDIFRGPPSLVVERQRVYVELLRSEVSVFELGCGRGEMLGLLKDAGISARGVDHDLGMVERARTLGVTVECGDALEHLRKEADSSLGGIFSAQFIEHIDAEQLIELLAVARTKLVPNGRFIAETVNPHSPRALKSFWVDPTHRHPLFPETLLALCRLTGFGDAEIMFPLGSGDLETDRPICGEYAVIASKRLQL